MDYIEKLNLQTEEIKEVENLEKHIIINSVPFSVNKYNDHTREFLALDGDYIDGFKQLKEVDRLGISCVVSKEVKEAREDVNGIFHEKLKDRIDSEVECLNSSLDNMEKELNSNINNTNNGLEFLSMNLSNILVDKSNYYGETLNIISQENKHLAFPTITKFNNEYYVFYRKGLTHVSFDGSIVYKKSSNMTDWSEEIVLVSEVGKDFRDPCAIIFNGKLVVKYFYRLSDTYVRTKICYTTDCINWNHSNDLPSLEVNPSNASRGNMCIVNNELYMVNYTCCLGSTENDTTFLVKTSDLINFTIHSRVKKNTNETSIVYCKNKFIAIFRQGTIVDGNDYRNALLYGESLDGISWSFKKLPLYGHCPSLHTLNVNNYGNIRLLLTWRDVSKFDSENVGYYNLICISTNGEILSRAYNLLWASSIFDLGYGDLFIDGNYIYFVFYISSNQSTIYYRVLPLDYVKTLSFYDNDLFMRKTVKYMNKSGVVSNKAITGHIIGDDQFTGNGTNKVLKSINLTALNISDIPINAKIIIRHDSGLFSYNIVNLTKTELKIQFIIGVGTFTSTIPFTYEFITIK